MAGLVLSVAEGASASQWRWVLTDADSGVPLADYTANVDSTAFEYPGFVDLYRFLRRNADPMRRVASEARLVNQVGAWVGANVLGGRVAEVLAGRAPVTVRVVLPPVLEPLMYRPLELAHVAAGVPLVRQPLVRHGVGLVYELPGAAAEGAGLGVVDGKAPVGDRLRILAVFSLPTGSSVLGLRRERYELVRLMRRLAARSRRAVEIEVLQYGVTRERLAERALDGEGWDVLHLSGHGLAGGLLLEKPDGGQDLLDAGQLSAALQPARSRMKLAVISACESGAASAAEAMRWLRLDQRAEELEQQAVEESTLPDGAADGVPSDGVPADGGAVPLAGVARELAGALDCAVVAMRFPVVDDFAIGFADQLYGLLMNSGQPVDAAVRLAVKQAAAAVPTPAAPAISVVTPALFGARAVGLRVQPPRRTAPVPPATTMAYFPGEPERFVGRSGPMATASSALAPESGWSGVLLHGMAGAGKTACALELAYRHETAFEGLAFWEAPKHADEAFTALSGLAVRLDTQLREFGLALVDKVGSVQALEEYLPQLTELLERSGLLIVLDNLETLLDEQGRWRDARWPPLIAALTGHDGESRVVLTSRIPPVGLDTGRMRVLPVHALSLTESVLLAREMPNLGTLLGAHAAGERGPAPTDTDAGRELVRRVLRLVQGHPKLLELADAAAADPAQLVGHLDVADADADQQALQAFFTRGETGLDPDQFFGALTTWTASTVATLPAASRLLLQLLCRAEDDDRTSHMLDGNWADLWRRLDRPGDPPDLDPTLAPLVAAALIDPDTPDLPPAPQPDADTAPVPSTGPTDDRAPQLVIYRIHPGVAENVRADTGPAMAEAADGELAAYWIAVYEYARTRPGGEDTGLIVRAGLAAAPYLLRLHEWLQASRLLEEAILRDSSPATARTVITHRETIARATGLPKDEGGLGRALMTIDPAAGERRLRHALAGALQEDDYRLAAGIAGELADALSDRGSLREALSMAERSGDYTGRAGLGPWTQLADEGRQLQIRLDLGEYQTVLDAVEQHRLRMAELPPESTADEAIDPFHVVEGMLGVGRDAATGLGLWDRALKLDAEVIRSKERREAGDYEIANTAFNDYGPLLRLGRLDDADTLLTFCQQVYEDADDTIGLSIVFSARANLEDNRDHHDEAIRLERRALRYKYVRPQLQSVAVSHYNLANYLRKADADPADQLAHRLAATLLRHRIGVVPPAYNRALARDLRLLGQQAVPCDFATLCDRLDQIEGVHFSVFFPDPGDGDGLLAEVLRLARSLPDSEVYAEAFSLWEPALAGIVVAAAGDQQATAAVTQQLGTLADTADWGQLVGVLRRILAGERDQQQLLTGLDDVDTAIGQRSLDALAGTVQLTATVDDLPLPRALHRWEPTIAGIVAAAGGNPQASTAVTQRLDDLAGTEDWGQLVGVLRRILAGERDPQVLLTGLDAIDTAIVRRTLDTVAGTVQLTATVDDLYMIQTLQRWEPMIAAIVQAVGGDPQATAAVTRGLDDLADSPDWGQLVGVLRRILAGERDEEQLLTGLDPTDTLIVGAILIRLQPANSGDDDAEDTDD